VEQLRMRLAPEDEAFVLTFNERVTNVIEPALVGSSAAVPWTTPLYRTKPDGQTALFDAITRGAEMLRSSTHERRAMVVLSDGRDTASQNNKAEASRYLLESNVLFYAVGLFPRGDLESDSRTLSHFADDTGGRVVFEPKVERLAAEFDSILSELRARYVLGFLTSESAKGAGETRKVRVFATDANGRPLKVRTRESFFIAGDSAVSENVK
jgi:Ca-activated chloride channel family protein